MACPSKVLIANRGEVVSRIVRTCRRLGIATVGVYTAADKELPFVRHVDESVCIESYMNGSELVKVALSLNCDAIHPGWGFLSEDYAFSLLVSSIATLLWIGPLPEAIARLGDKGRAKDAARGILPLLEGGSGSDAELLAHAKRIGFPVLLKAANGGGGRGQRVVNNLSEWEDNVAIARGEASSFGNGSDSVLVERFVRRGRHVEVQIVGDLSFNCMALGDRDCSVQRRRQKVVEESPAPFLSDALRVRMLSGAVELAEHCKYHTVGTVEFLFDMDSKEYFFLEVNTRLQVEHTVSEEVWNVDLVAIQIRTAAGHSLETMRRENQIPRDKINLNPLKHAIQLRLCAEDADDHFKGSFGLVARCIWPENCRVECGIASGSEISPFFDGMVAKLIVSGLSRSACVARAIEAVLATRLVGDCVFNLPGLLGILTNQDFVTGMHHTTWLQELRLNPPLDSLENDCRNLVDFVQKSPRAHASGVFRNVAPASGGGRLLLRDMQSGNLIRIQYSSKSLNLNGKEIALTGASQRSAEVYSWKNNSRLGVVYPGVESLCRVRRFERLPRTDWYLDSVFDPLVSNNLIESGYLCAVPSTVLSLAFREGHEVEAGQTLLTLESMKMQTAIRAHTSGRVQYFVQKGDVVKQGTRLCQVE